MLGSVGCLLVEVIIPAESSRGASGHTALAADRTSRAPVPSGVASTDLAIASLRESTHSTSVIRSANGLNESG